jgi:hypothetical protein
MAEQIETLTTVVQGVVMKLESVDHRLDNLTSKVLDMDEYLHTEVATKTELHAVETRLMGHIDGLYRRSDTLDIETLANRNRSERLEGRVDRLEKTVGLA